MGKHGSDVCENPPAGRSTCVPWEYGECQGSKSTEGGGGWAWTRSSSGDVGHSAWHAGKIFKHMSENDPINQLLAKITFKNTNTVFLLLMISWLPSCYAILNSTNKSKSHIYHTYKIWENVKLKQEQFTHSSFMFFINNLLSNIQ